MDQEAVNANEDKCLGTAAKMIGTYAKIAAEGGQLAGNPIGQANGLRSLVNVAREMAGFVLAERNNPQMGGKIHFDETTGQSYRGNSSISAICQSAHSRNHYTGQLAGEPEEHKNVNDVLGYQAAAWGSHMEEADTPRQTLHKAINAAMSMSSQGEFFVSAPAHKGGKVFAHTNGIPTPEQGGEMKTGR